MCFRSATGYEAGGDFIAPVGVSYGMERDQFEGSTRCPEHTKFGDSLGDSRPMGREDGNGRMASDSGARSRQGRHIAGARHIALLLGTPPASAPQLGFTGLRCSGSEVTGGCLFQPRLSCGPTGREKPGKDFQKEGKRKQEPPTTLSSTSQEAGPLFPSFLLGFSSSLSIEMRYG